MRPAPRCAGDEGVWFFITADVSMFALFFGLFMEGRSRGLALFEQSRLVLDAPIGLINTLILLTSSLFVARAVHALRVNKRAAAQRSLSLGLGVGFAFALTKIYEYSEKFAHGVTLSTNDFFMYYFVLTGIHFLHYAAGMVFLALSLAKVRAEPVEAPLRNWVESTGCYWHMVDLLWIVLFPMLYLMRAG